MGILAHRRPSRYRDVANPALYGLAMADNTRIRTAGGDAPGLIAAIRAIGVPPDHEILAAGSLAVGLGDS